VLFSEYSTTCADAKCLTPDGSVNFAADSERQAETKRLWRRFRQDNCKPANRQFKLDSARRNRAANKQAGSKKGQDALFRSSSHMAGLGNNPVQVLSTGRDLHWEFLRLWTGFELPSSCRALPCYAADLKRNSFCVMRWPHIDLGAQDLNDIQRPKSFHKNSWK
jgi:hypothetical protein